LGFLISLWIAGRLISNPTWVRAHVVRQPWRGPNEDLWRVTARVHGIGACESIRISALDGGGRVLGIHSVRMVPAGSTATFLAVVPREGPTSAFELTVELHGESSTVLVRPEWTSVP
jgi:hypothetical protein